jgi:hypothetical protein
MRVKSWERGNTARKEVPAMLEKSIVTAIMKHLKTVPHCFAWKQHGGQYGRAGLPDIICCIEGRFVAFEVKTPHGKLTKIQEITIQKINAAKGKAYKVTSVEDVKLILDSLEGNPYEKI